MLRAALVTSTQSTSVHRLQKGRHQIHGGNSINSQSILKLSLLSLFPVNSHRTSYASLHYRETLMSETERQLQTNALINDKLRCTVVTY